MSTDLEQKLAPVLDRFMAGGGARAVLVSRPDLDASWGCNAQASFPSASLIKVAIACAAWDAHAAGDVDLNGTVEIAELEPTAYCSILAGFAPERGLSLRDLIGLMLIISDNPATTRVLEAVGFDAVQAWLARHGLEATNLDIGFRDAELGPPLRANRTTAQDCLRLLDIVRVAPAYAPIRVMLENNLRNERIPRLLPDSAVIAHKTGTLAGLSHDIALVREDIAGETLDYALALLTDGQDDVHRANTDMATAAHAIHAVMGAALR